MKLVPNSDFVANGTILVNQLLALGFVLMSIILTVKDYMSSGEN